MGLEPLGTELSNEISSAKAIYVLAADPVGDLTAEMPEGAFLVVQELYHTTTVENADVVFPARSFLEREGTFTSGERVVQRFYPAVAPYGEGAPDWEILVWMGEKLGVELPGGTAADVMQAISTNIADYAEVNYRSLLHTELQWPHVGDDDLYFGGTAYKNDQGLGFHLESAAERGETFNLVWTTPEEAEQAEGLLIVPVTRLLDGATTVRPSELLNPRLAPSQLWMNPDDLSNLGLEDGAGVELSWNGHNVQIPAMGKDTVPSGSALVPRSLGVPIHTPIRGKISPTTE
jgi:NADH-quinone oxidoreductase subunit G